MTFLSAVIVTHNSEAVIGQCIAGLKAQSLPPSTIIIVDSGSSSTDFLLDMCDQNAAKLIPKSNIGFSKANNLGLAQCLEKSDFVVFINPDAFLAHDALERALEFCSSHQEVGCLCGKQLRYDLEQNSPSNIIDSSGIYRKWYGRWVDRGQGAIDSGQFDDVQEVPAACGAFLFCQRQMLMELMEKDGFFFDPDFFMYKEDIELSLRMRRAGWKIMYHSQVLVYHCRGWAKERNEVPYEARLMSAGNEILLYRKQPSIYMLWALLKYVLVRFFRF